MKSHLCLSGVLFFSLLFLKVNGQLFQGNTSASYEEAIGTYTRLAEENPDVRFDVVGSTDIGRPLHLFVIDRPSTQPKATVLVNNGIHPGEPCGIDASLLLAEHLLDENNPLSSLLDHVTVAIVPVYNIGGALRRGKPTRANQNGPEEYGFRGNARNLDLNRDFIKAEAANTRSFYTLFHQLKPHVVIDTHTSNGADYSYVMTMISTQPDKAGYLIGNYLKEKMTPALYKAMEQKAYAMIPYVNTIGKIPDDGIRDFLETPRYTTGYTALFNTIGFTSETHMLKPFAQRVESTYLFLHAVLAYTHEHFEEIIELKATSDREVENQKIFPLNWELDTTQWRMIPFKGYEAETPKSKVTGEQRLKYNRARPFEREIRYYDHYRVNTEVEAPRGYIIPQAWREVIERFELNHVEMTRVKSDTTMNLEVYYIDEFSASPSPYEGRHVKTVTSLRKTIETVTVYSGDYLVYTDQKVNRFIVETLEPEGVDSYFRWGFFDSVLQQKEWYSDYVFEDTAEEMLANDAALKQEFEAAKAADEQLKSSPRAQLYWLYKRSEFYEETPNRYPIYRMR